MVLDLSIFKSYDVRGVYPETLNEEVAEKIGAAVVHTIRAKTLVVGRDMRESSTPLSRALMKGIISQGCDVVDIGLCSTDMLYFASGHLNVDGGIMVTASHNPGKDNGLKFCGKKAAPIGMGSGLEKIRDACAEENENGIIPAAQAKGTITSQTILHEYTQNCLALIQPAQLKPFTLVVDAGNGMGGLTWKAVQEKIPCKTIPLYFELDGTFPHHVPNPLLPENIAFLQKEVVQHHADVGIAFDGDADRAVLVDEKGHVVSGSEATALISAYLLSKKENEHSTILYDLRCSKMVPETIVQHGGKPRTTRVGHSHIKKIMKEENALFAGELSGHYYFRENFNADSGMMAALVLLQIISNHSKPLSELVTPLRKKWHHSGEINFTVQNKEEKINELKKKYSGKGTLTEMDGLTIDCGEWWFNVRPSNTEPFLRLCVEARDEDTLQRKQAELTQIIKNNPF